SVAGYIALRNVVDPDELIGAVARGGPAPVGGVGELHEQEGIADAVGNIGHADLAVEKADAVLAVLGALGAARNVGATVDAVVLVHGVGEFHAAGIDRGANE